MLLKVLAIERPLAYTCQVHRLSSANQDSTATLEKLVQLFFTFSTRAKLLSTQPQKEGTSKMATGANLTGENGQFHHASRLTWVTCLLTLHLCTAYTHATAAPIQYWPACGSTLLYGHRAAVVHSEQITEKALKATQNAPQIENAETLKDFARESYDRYAHSWAAK